MEYFVDLFSPETAKAFSGSARDVSGFRISRKTYVENQKIGPGDKFICYCTRIQRFIGVLKVLEGPYIDSKPIFALDEDPFVLRFRVKPQVWLSLEKGIPIHDDRLWTRLSFTKKLKKDDNSWTYLVFSSPRLWPGEDSEFLEEELVKQSKELKDYPFTEEDQKKLKPSKIKIGATKEVLVNVPDDNEVEEGVVAGAKAVRESIKTQALLARIGETLGFKIWLPISDRSRVLKEWKPKPDTLLEDLPLVFDESTLKTIKNIDVLWIKRRSIVRAFEVEHKTSIYSGLLRMGDLLALQPMLNIKIHIAAPDGRRESVFAQITRPVFADISGRVLSEDCSFISYTSISELAKEEKLEFMTDGIVDAYTEFAQD